MEIWLGEDGRTVLYFRTNFQMYQKSNSWSIIGFWHCEI